MRMASLSCHWQGQANDENLIIGGDFADNTLDLAAEKGSVPAIGSEQVHESTCTKARIETG